MTQFELTGFERINIWFPTLLLEHSNFVEVMHESFHGCTTAPSEGEGLTILECSTQGAHWLHEQLGFAATEYTLAGDQKTASYLREVSENVSKQVMAEILDIDDMSELEISNGIED